MLISGLDAAEEDDGVAEGASVETTNGDAVGITAFVGANEGISVGSTDGDSVKPEDVEYTRFEDDNSGIRGDSVGAKLGESDSERGVWIDGRAVDGALDGLGEELENGLEGLDDGALVGALVGLKDGLVDVLVDGLDEGLVDGLEEGRADGLEEGLVVGLEDGLGDGALDGVLLGVSTTHPGTVFSTTVVAPFQPQCPLEKSKGMLQR